MICTKCNTDKPETREFFYFDNKTSKFKPMCKECGKAYAKKHYKINGHKTMTLEEQREYHLKKKYGITGNEYNELLQIQGGGCCAICKVSPEEYTATSKWYSGSTTHRSFAVDHCHSTGKVRGILCDKCNRGYRNVGRRPCNSKDSIHVLNC